MQDLASEKLTTEQGVRASPTQKPTASTFDFMVVSNRLPVDRYSNDGDTNGGDGWRSNRRLKKSAYFSGEVFTTQAAAFAAREE